MGHLSFSRFRMSAMLLALSIGTFACSGGPMEDRGVTGDIAVYAASSLTEAFNEVGEHFEAQHEGANVLLNFVGSTTLRTQIEQGAPADVFASANQQQMALAVSAGVIDGEPRDFATNSLMLITPAGNDSVRTLGDLANEGISLVLALPDVPVGSYARQAIEAMGASGNFGEAFAARVFANVASEESNVRQVAAKVALGEADAGIVYSTDVTQDVTDRVQTIAIPVEYNVAASYPIAKVAGAANPEGADAFIDFVLAPDAQAILANHGFGSATQ